MTDDVVEVTATLRERWYIVAIAALLAVTGVVFLLVRSDDKPRPAHRSVLPAAPQLDSGGVALASLLTRSRDATYHATYTSSGDLRVSRGSVAMEMWNKDGKSRVDTTLTTSDKQVVRTASIVNGRKAVVCQKSTTDWTCSSAPTAKSGDAPGLVASLQSQLSRRAVNETPGKVGDREARCFQVAPASGAEELGVCVDPTRGILLKLSSSEAQIEIDTLDSSVPANVFDAPAAVKS